MSVLERIRNLTPTGFENFTYDLMTCTGLRNVAWRTPGVDGGRDIQGDFYHLDLAGEVTPHRWYVECKHYERALSWPLIREKLAFAENHRAHYLLLCTTSELSPKCRDEVATWNERRTRPLVRAWGGAQLANHALLHPTLLSKYELSDAKQAHDAAALPLALLGLKAVHAAYGTASLTGEPARSLEYAATLVELVHARLERGSVETLTSRSPEPFPWCDLVDNCSLAGFDPNALRAVLAAVRFVARAKRLSLRRADFNGTPRLQVSSAESLDHCMNHELLYRISLWSNLEVLAEAGAITVVRRAETA